MKARLTRDRTLPTLALLGVCAAGPAAILHFFGRDQVDIPSAVHFFGIGVSAGLAWVAAVALTLVGARRSDGRAVLLGTAFSVMAAILTIHGLSTPGFIVEMNGLVAFSGAATLPAGGAVLALVALPAARTPRGVRPLLFLQAGLLIVIAAVGTVGMLVPDAVPAVPEAASPVALTVMAVALVFYLVLAVRAARTFLLTRRKADLLVVFGVSVLGAAVVPALVLGPTDLGWWLGHLFELAGIVIVGVPVALDLHRGAQSRPLAGDLRGAELVQAADAFMGATIRALLARLAEKDEYTAGHTKRVALLAVQVGEELGLPPSRLRYLAMGGLLHDIGKLSVPDAILQKPAALDEHEFAVIQGHPELGCELVNELGGFHPQVSRLVLDHHERLDGSGYPRGMKGEELDLETRVMGVCDVYDALMSTRVYREAWSQERALALLHAEAGTAFDPQCVEALVRVLERHAPVAIAAARAA
ncbi:MAG TPA: HD-GYP domain-containing protein [Thermoleophilaceae bacterium]